MFDWVLNIPLYTKYYIEHWDEYSTNKIRLRW